MLFALLVFAACFLAYANGANDNFKGVASLYGSDTTGFRTALGWGTATTLAGSITAIFFAEGLLKKFSGKGLVSDALTQSPNFLLAVALGAAFTVLLATRFGFPISTTHGLTGALVGAGLAADGHTVNFGALGKNFVQPLLLSPVLAVAAGALIYLVLKCARFALESRRADRALMDRHAPLRRGAGRRGVDVAQPIALNRSGSGERAESCAKGRAPARPSEGAALQKHVEILLAARFAPDAEDVRGMHLRV